MPIQYALDAPFELDGASVQAQNIILARHTAAIPMHSHGSGCWEIHLIPTGRGMLTVGSQHYEISPGTLFVTGPHVEHAQSPDAADPMWEYCIYLRIRNAANCDALQAFCGTPFWFAQDDGAVHSLMRQLFDELEHRRTGWRLAAQLLLSQLLLMLSRRCETHTGDPLPTSQPVPANRSTLLIEECFLYEYATVTLPILAQRLGLSERQTQRLLRDTYSSTFQRMKADAQMSAAVSLLRDPALSITQIAEQLGFSSPEHFSGAFSRHYGMSPRAWRKQNL